MSGNAEHFVGRQLVGYRLLAVLGRGGMSLVFLAERLDDAGVRVALKILRPAHGVTAEEFPSFQTRFLREAETVQRLHHDHILPVLEYGEEDGLLYMVMPLIADGTLAQRLAASHDPLPFAEVAGYLTQLASAIDYAHQQGFLHRDIKPGNVLLDEQGRVYLVDFGIAHLFESGLSAIDEAPTTITTTGTLYGTPTFMAPERFKGEQAQPASDIYALGVLLFQLVTDQLPFTADTAIAIGMKHVSEAPPLPHLLRPDLPEPAEAAILRALAKEPSARFATATALAEAFDAGIKGQWVPGLRPVFPVQTASPDLDETQKQEAQLVPVVPLPDVLFPSNQLVLGPAPMSAANGVPVADETTQAQQVPVVPTRSREQGGRRMLFLIAATLAVVVLLIVLPLFAFQQWHLSPTPAHTVRPTSTLTAPTRTGATPASSGGATPTLSPQRTPTAGRTPTPSPHTTPSPTPRPSPSPTPTVFPSPTPTAKPTAATSQLKSLA